MRIARLRIVPGGGRCCNLVPGGREVLWPGPRGGGGRCCDLVLGGGEDVLWPGPGGGGEGGVVSWSQEREGGVVTWSRGGGEVLWPGLGGEGVPVTWCRGGGGVVSWSQEGGREVLCPGPRRGEGRREVLWPGPRWEGGVMTFGIAHLPPLNRMSDTGLWKHNLHSLRYVGGKNGQKIAWHSLF